jgi:ATP-binding cassette, subfamily B, putative efflux pump
VTAQKEGQILSSVRRYLEFVKPYRLQIIGTIIIGIVKFAIPLMIPMLIKYVVDDIIGASGLTNDEKLNKLLIIMGIMIVVFVVVRPPIEYYRQYFAQWTSSKILYDIRDRMYTHIQKLSFKYYARNSALSIMPTHGQEKLFHALLMMLSRRKHSLLLV